MPRIRKVVPLKEVPRPSPAAVLEPEPPAETTTLEQGHSQVEEQTATYPAPTRPRGRPKGSNAPFDSQFPIPSRFEFLKAEEFFAYLRSIPKEKRNRGMLTFYRYIPVPIEKDPSYIRKIPMDADNYPFDNEDWEHAILSVFGCGKYGCYVNETNLPPLMGSKTICRIYNIKTRWDLENFPPVMDPADVDEAAEENGSYIQWLRARGIKSPSQLQQGQDEMAISEKMIDVLIGQAQRANTPVPPPRETPSERLNGEAASAAIGLFRTQAENILKSQSNQTDPTAIIQGYVTLAQTMKGNDDGSKALTESLLRQIEAERARNATLMDRLLDIRLAPPAATTPQQQPKSLMDQLREMKDMKELLSDFMGMGGQAEAAADKPTSVKEMMIMKAIENAPNILSAGSAIIGQLIQGATAVTAISKGQPIPESAKPAEVAAAAQPAATPLTLPAGWEEAKVRRYFQAFGVVGTPLVDHFKRAVADNSEPPENGYTFAEWFINGFGEVPAYTSIVSDCKNADSAVDLEPLMTVIKQYPPIWGQVATVETEFRQFLAEFVCFKLPPEQGGPEIEPEEQQQNGMPVIPRTGAAIK